MPVYRLVRRPNPLRDRRTTLDNVAVVPASLLPYKKQWQDIANQLPTGSILICVPTRDRHLRPPYLAVARGLRDKGFTVLAIAAESVAGQV